MKFFAGIVPPPDIYNKLLHIQQQHGDNRLEPHITLRPPVSPLNDEAWLNTITEVAATIEPFNVMLPGTGNFGKRVLFISVDSPPLINLYDRLIPALRQFEEKDVNKEHEKFHPHLTLGRAWCGFTPEDFKNMKQMSEEYLTAGNVSFGASHIRIYHKPDHHGRYQPYQDVLLGG